jgi:glutathione S-transferase
MSGQKGANYHLKCTGDALKTVEAHEKSPPSDATGEGLHLFGASEYDGERESMSVFGASPESLQFSNSIDFCPFVHRVWIGMELLGLDYRYVEVDPYKKTQELLDVNPKGLVPALKIGEEGKCLGESTVILEYLADRYDSKGKSHLLPLKDPYIRAQHRLQADKVNRGLIPSFYRYLQAQEEEKQIELAKEFIAELEAFTASMKAEQGGSFWDGSDQMGWMDMSHGYLEQT